MFGPDSMQVDYGSHTLVIDAEGRKVRVFSDWTYRRSSPHATVRVRSSGEAVRTRRQNAERGPFGAVGQRALRGGFVLVGQRALRGGLVLDQHEFDGRDHPACLG